MSIEENKALVRRFFEEIDKGNVGAMDEIAFVLAIGRQAGHDLVALGDLVLDLVMSGRRVPEHRQRLLQPLPTRSDSDVLGMFQQLGVIPPMELPE